MTAVVYGRQYDDGVLNFEASGALMKASLVMRDRETDSWWSIMTSDAIGGPMQGAELVELPLGEKSTWGDWRRRHPDTLVLSVDGVEHEPHNPYDDYFVSARTFRDLEVADDRLPAKAPIYSFHLDGRPWAAPHAAFEGGRMFELDYGGRRVLLHRPRGASVFASTRAYLLTGDVADRPIEDLLAAGARGDLEPLPGFDTYWYTWVSINEQTELLAD